jgi:hypothetical protein
MTVDQTLPASVRLYFRGLREGDGELFASAFSASAAIHDPVGTEPVSGAALRQVPAHVASLFARFDGVEPDETYRSGTAVSVRWTGRGTNADHDEITWSGITTFFLDDTGLIETGYAVFDLAAVGERLAGRSS